jgi:hypothetical protein
MPDNQTKDEWLELPTVANDPGAKGTGVFLLQANTLKEYAIDITYDTLLLKDSIDNFYAFAWVPHAVAFRRRQHRQSQ